MSIQYMREHPMIVLLAVGAVAVLAVLLTATNGGLLRSAVTGSGAGPSSSSSSAFAGISYEEEFDGGDDPMTPGCVKQYSSLAAIPESCQASDFRAVFGDRCTASGALLERTLSPDCHESFPGDDFDYSAYKRYDCAVVCQAAGWSEGRCDDGSDDITSSLRGYCSGYDNVLERFVTQSSAECDCFGTQVSVSESVLFGEDDQYTEAASSLLENDEYVEASYEPDLFDDLYIEEATTSEPRDENIFDFF